MGESRLLSMRKDFEKEVYCILTQAGNKGLKTEHIARHVFNSFNSMFQPLDYKEVRNCVSQMLIRHSRKSDSPIEKGEGCGVYRLNPRSQAARQIMIQFADWSEDDKPEEKAKDCDNSLLLF